MSRLYTPMALGAADAVICGANATWGYVNNRPLDMWACVFLSVLFVALVLLLGHAMYEEGRRAGRMEAKP